MKEKRKNLGKRGEHIAASFLCDNGYKIIDKNFVIKGLGEIDIVCKKKNKIIFVEVRTKSTSRYGAPEESITAKKQWKLSQLAYAYLNIKKWHNHEFAIDGIFVEKKGDEYEVRHLPNMLQDF